MPSGPEPGPPATEIPHPIPDGSYFAEIPLGAITPNPRQPRTVFDEEAMAELVHSIQEVGLLQPVVVRPMGADESGPRYELVMGERRWRAAQEAGLTTIPAIIRETDDTDMLRDAVLHARSANAFYLPVVTKIDFFGRGHEPFDESEFSRRRLTRRSRERRISGGQERRGYRASQAARAHAAPASRRWRRDLLTKTTPKAEAK
jgi:ParB family chromosome partitioning protein